MLLPDPNSSFRRSDYFEASADALSTLADREFAEWHLGEIQERYAIDPTRFKNCWALLFIGNLVCSARKVEERSGFVLYWAFIRSITSEFLRRRYEREQCDEDYNADLKKIRAFPGESEQTSIPTLIVGFWTNLGMKVDDRLSIRLRSSLTRAQESFMPFCQTLRHNFSLSVAADVAKFRLRDPLQPVQNFVAHTLTFPIFTDLAIDAGPEREWSETNPETGAEEFFVRFRTPDYPEIRAAWCGLVFALFVRLATEKSHSLKGFRNGDELQQLIEHFAALFDADQTDSNEIIQDTARYFIDFNRPHSIDAQEIANEFSFQNFTLGASNADENILYSLIKSCCVAISDSLIT